MIQGITFGVILLNTSSPRKKANFFLAILLFFFAYRLFTAFLHTWGWLSYQKWTYHVFVEMNWVYGSLIYFYILALLGPRFQWTKQHWVHFIPLGIELIFSNYVKTLNFYWDGTLESISTLGNKSYVLWMHTPFQFIVAFGLIIFYSLRSRKKILSLQKQKHSIENKSGYLHAKWIIAIYILFSVAVILCVAVDFLFWDYAFNPIYNYLVYTALAVLTYGLGIFGLLTRKEKIIFRSKPKGNNQEGSEILQKLKVAMQEQALYLEPDLNVEKLAQAIGVKTYLLRATLNQQLEQTFSDFINNYRVEAFKQKLTQSEYSNYTLLSIGLDSGFSSKATFTRAVKKHTGLTPKSLKASLNTPPSPK